MLRTVCDVCEKTILQSKLIEVHTASVSTGGMNVAHICSYECLEKHGKAKKKPTITKGSK